MYLENNKQLIITMNLDNNKSQKCIVQQTTNHNIFGQQTTNYNVCVQQLIITVYLDNKRPIIEIYLDNNQTSNYNNVFGQRTHKQL